MNRLASGPGIVADTALEMARRLSLEQGWWETAAIESGCLCCGSAQ